MFPSFRFKLPKVLSKHSACVFIFSSNYNAKISVICLKTLDLKNLFLPSLNMFYLLCQVIILRIPLVSKHLKNFFIVIKYVFISQ